MTGFPALTRYVRVTHRWDTATVQNCLQTVTSIPSLLNIFLSGIVKLACSSLSKYPIRMERVNGLRKVHYTCILCNNCTECCSIKVMSFTVSLVVEGLVNKHVIVR